MIVTRDRFDARLASKVSGPTKGFAGASTVNTDTKQGYRLRLSALSTDKGAQSMDNDMPNKIEVYDDAGNLPEGDNSKNYLIAAAIGVVVYFVTKYIN